MKNTKKQLETVHHPCAQGPRFKRPATNPRLNYSPSASSSPSLSLSIFTQQSAVLPETEWTAQKASSSKKLADASASNDRPNTEIRFILSFLWSVPFSFRRLGQRLTSFHGLYLSSRIISFVSLLRQPNDHFESAVYHTRGGGRGEEAQFNRGNRAIFPAIVPSFLPLAPPRSTIENPQPDRSNRERGRVIFASTWCNFTKFHDRISRFICKRGSFFWWLLIGFYFVNFFLRRGGGGGGEKERISFRKFDESWCKIDIRGFFFVFFSTVDFNDSCNYFNGCR